MKIKKVYFSGCQNIMPFDKKEFLEKNMFCDNIGNIFFANAVYNHLMLNNHLILDSYNNCIKMLRFESKGIHDSMIVVTLANSFAYYATEHLKRITENIKLIKIPTVIVGVGGGGTCISHMEFKNGEHKQAVYNFCKTVLETTPSIGVRGELTAELLIKELGFPRDTIDVIGCPSLRYYGKFFDKCFKRADTQKVKDLSMNINTNFTAYARSPKLTEFLLRVWKHHRNSTVLFTDKYEGDLLLNGIPIDNTLSRFHNDIPCYKEHFMMKQGRCYFFLSHTDIINHLGNYDFSFGSRIHGNVAAILAGIPVMQISYNSRTLEISKFHNIPFMFPEEITTINNMYEKSLIGMEKYYASYNDNLQIYIDFLKKNKVPVNYTFLEKTSSQ